MQQIIFEYTNRKSFKYISMSILLLPIEILLNVINLVPEKISTNKGTAIFYHDKLELVMGSKNIHIQYINIININICPLKSFLGIPSSVYKLEIGTTEDKIVIVCSHNESRKFKKYGITPQIKIIYDNLSYICSNIPR